MLGFQGGELPFDRREGGRGRKNDGGGRGRGRGGRGQKIEMNEEAFPTL